MMTAVVMAVATGVLVSANGAAAAGTFEVLGTSPTAGSGSNALDANSYPFFMSVTGDYVVTFESASSRAAVLSAADPAHPTVVGRTPAVGSPGAFPSFTGASAAVVQGTHAYFIDNSWARLSVMDLGTPTAPMVVGNTPAAPASGSFPNSSSIRGLAVRGNYAYVTEQNDHSLAVVDVSNPAAPVVVAHTPAPGSAGGFLVSDYPRVVTVNGNYAYVGSSEGVFVVDVSSPLAPYVVGRLPANGTPGGIVGGFPYDIVYLNGFVYANFADSSGPTSDVYAVDVSTPAAPVIAGKLPTPGTPGGFPNSSSNSYGMGLVGSSLIVTDYGNDTVHVVSIANPASPVVVASLPAAGAAGGVPAGSGPYGVTSVGGRAMVSLYNSSQLAILDVSSYTPPPVSSPPSAGQTNQQTTTAQPTAARETTRMPDTGAPVAPLAGAAALLALAGAMLLTSRHRARVAGKK